MSRPCAYFFFFNDTATTEIYTLSLHDALPISERLMRAGEHPGRAGLGQGRRPRQRAGLADEDLQVVIQLQVLIPGRDRKSTRLNSSHSQISYAVFCLKKKKQTDRACPTSMGCP